MLVKILRDTFLSVKKKILVNAISIKEGGGAVVFSRTINEMCSIEKNIQWVVVIDPVLINSIEKKDNIEILTFPWVKKTPLHFIYWNEFFLKKLAHSIDADCFFSVVNTLPIRKLPCPTLLSVLHAGYFSNEFIALNSKSNPSFKNKFGFFIRKYWVFLSIKRATKVITPTKALENQIIGILRIERKKITTILPGLGLSEGTSEEKKFPIKKTWKIGYITKYGVQKNFDTLFQAAAKLKSEKIDFRIVLTLNENLNTFDCVKRLIDQYDIGSYIENYGEVSEEKIQVLYRTLDIFVFPSLCESIGFSLLESMHYGLPIAASDVHSNRELLGEGGLFFHPHDHVALYKKILEIVQNQQHYENLSLYSVHRSKIFSWKNSARETLEAIRGLLCNTN